MSDRSIGSQASKDPAFMRRQRFLAAKKNLDEQENKDIENEELKI